MLEFIPLPAQIRLRYLLATLVLLAMLVLTACATSPADIVSAASQSAEDSGGGLAKQMADKLLGEVSGQDHRSVRMCMIAAVASELVTYRMTLEPEQAPAGYGQIALLQSAVAQFERADGMWLNTEIAHVTLTMTSIMVDNAKARLPKLLSNFAGGVNVLGLLDRAAIAAGQGTLLAAGIQDIKERVLALNTGTADGPSSMAACKARLAFNRDKVGSILGAAEVDAVGAAP